MAEETKLTPEEEKALATDVKKDAKGLLKSVTTFLSELLDIRGETDKDQTIDDIKKDIAFKGHTAWILIFAVFIASIGLNVSSTAVVIGAMLISPLMGPILGIGLSLAIYDLETLKRSLVNLGVMVGLSVFTAWLYFSVSPLTELTPELEARTAPTILDVLIAIFGGLALIVARSKKGTIATVIFGVAIATALMPPLCAVGYGLAIGDPEFYIGALYLFTINTIFIALATFVVAKILGFPLVKYANEKKRNRIKWTVTVVALLAIVPASFTFYNVWKETNFNVAAKRYIKNEIKSNDALQLLEDDDYDFKTKIIHLSFYNEITPAIKSDLLNDLKGYPNLVGVNLKIKSSNTGNFELVKDLLEEKRIEVRRQRDEITELQNKIIVLEEQVATQTKQKSLDFLTVSKDAKINFSNLKSLGFSKELKSNFRKIDTLPVARVQWKSEVTDSLSKIRNDKLAIWLQKEMKLDTVYVKK